MTEILIDMSNGNELLCRGCLCTASNLCSLFSNVDIDYDLKYSQDVTYHQMFEECTSIKIRKQDGLPNNLCSDCIEELTASYCFRNKCQISNKELHLFEITVKEENDSVFSEVDELETSETNEQDFISYKTEETDINDISMGLDKTTDEHTDIYSEEQSELDSLTERIDEESIENEYLDEENEILEGEIDTLDETDIKNEEPCDMIKTGEETHLCPVCKEEFTTLNELLIHNAVHNPKKPFRCYEKKCRTCSFKTEQELEMHNFVYHTNQGATEKLCRYCKKQFTSIKSLRCHLRTHSNDKPHICKYCEKAFVFSHHLRNHEKIHENLKQFLCTDCGKKFITKDRLHIHQRIHSDKRPYRCDICNKGFITNTSLKFHQTIHTSEKPFMCNLCGLCFKLEDFLRSHVKKMHSGQNGETKARKSKPKGVKVTFCKICDTNFETSSEYNKHLKKHSYKHQCPICSKPFALAGKLETHIKHNHQKTLKHQCHICDEMFHRPDLLKYHNARFHSDGKLPFICELCGKGFVQNCDYKVHKRRHAGERPFACNVCDKKYVTSTELIQHTRLHTGEKPYVCNICQKSLATINALLYHIKTHNSSSTNKIYGTNAKLFDGIIVDDENPIDNENLEEDFVSNFESNTISTPEIVDETNENMLEHLNEVLIV